MGRTMLVTASIFLDFSLAADAFCIHGLWVQSTKLLAHKEGPAPLHQKLFEDYKDNYLQTFNQDEFYSIFDKKDEDLGETPDKFPVPIEIVQGALRIRFQDGTILEDPVERPQIPDEELNQTLSEFERSENLGILRSIKYELTRLNQPNNALKREEALERFFNHFHKDTWFGVNERMIDALEWGAPPKTMDYLRGLADKLGGPPPGVTLSSEGVALDPHVFDGPLTPAEEFHVLHRAVLEFQAERRQAVSRRRKWNPYTPDESDIDMLIHLALRDPRLKAGTEEEIAEELELKRDLVRNALGDIPYIPSRREFYEEEEQKAIDFCWESFQLWKQWKGGHKFGIEDTVSEPDSAHREEDEDFDEEGEEERVHKLMRFVQRPDNDKEGFDEDEYELEDWTPEEKERLAKIADFDSVRDTGMGRRGFNEDEHEAYLTPDMKTRLANVGNLELLGDMDICLGKFNSSTEPYSSCTSGPLTVEVFSEYDKSQTGPPIHNWVYTVSITNNSPTNTTKLIGRRFEVQTIGSDKKRVIELAGVTGINPIIKPGGVFEYSSKAPLELNPFRNCSVAARMQGHYYYETWDAETEVAKADRGLDQMGEAKIAPLHLLFPAIDEESSSHKFALAMEAPETTGVVIPKKLISGDEDMRKGEFEGHLNQSSTAITGDIEVVVNSSYVPEKSDPAKGKHCFSYHVSISNRGSDYIQLVGRRFEVQTVLQSRKNVIEGDDVMGAKPVISPGQTYTYSSLAPLEVDSALGSTSTQVVGRMQGEYRYEILDDDWSSPHDSAARKSAKLGVFHFVFPGDQDRQKEY